MIESKVISAVLGNVDALKKCIESGINNEMFVDIICSNLWDEIIEHYKKYGNSPDIDHFCDKHDEFEFINVNEKIEPLIDELFNNIRCILSAQYIKNAAEKIVSKTDCVNDLILNLKELPSREDCKENAEYLKNINIRELYDYFSDRLTTGFVGLDDKFKGYEQTDLIYLLARPMIGKSTFMKIAAMHQAKQGVKSLIMTSEEVHEIIFSEIACLACNINPAKFRRRELDETDIEILEVYIDEMKEKGDIVVVDNETMTPNMIKKNIEIFNPDIWYVDTFSVMQYDGKIYDRTQRFEQIAIELEKICKGYSKPGVILHHIHRQMKYAAYTDEVERRADKIFRLDVNDNQKSEKKMQFTIVKFRGDTNFQFNDGKSNSAIFDWDFDTCNFKLIDMDFVPSFNDDFDGKEEREAY